MKRRFKKLGFRTMGVVLGLWLGWQAAGFAEGDGESPVGEANHGESHLAEALTPSDASSAWYPAVIVAVIAIFVAAIVIGRPAMQMKGDEPVEEDDHGHDDHGHDGDDHAH